MSPHPPRNRYGLRSRFSTPKGGRRPVSDRRTRPRLERLEERAVPAVISWDGGAGDLSWINPLNWDGDVVPGAGDDVVIDYGANNFTVIHSSGMDSVRSITSRADLNVSGGQLTVAADSHFFGGLSVGGLLVTAADLTVDGPFSSSGTLAGLGSLTANGGSTLLGCYFGDGFRYVNPQGRTANSAGGIGLYRGGSIENAGTFLLNGDGRTYYDDPSATFHNAATGSLIKTAGDTGQDNYVANSSFFSVSVVNDGLIRADVGTIGFGLSSAPFANHGRIVARAATGQPKATLWVLNGNAASDGSVDADRVRFLGTTTDARIPVTGPYTPTSRASTVSRPCSPGPSSGWVR